MEETTKQIGSIPEVSNLAQGDMIVSLNAAGAGQRITPGNLKTAMIGSINLNALEDGIFIMFHRKRDDYPLMVKPHKWASYQSSGEVAEGVVVVEGGKCLVVAPTESTTGLLWSSAAVSGGGVLTQDRLTALNDWAGKENTTAQMTKSECNTASYAPGFCGAYSRVNANGKGLIAGKWWLPSLGEMTMIYANMTKINYALSLINGATQLAETQYFVSTEVSSTYAWYLHIGDGTASAGQKETNKGKVRAVSAFIS